MNGRSFLDTNILVYAYDASDAARHAKALKLIEDISHSSAPVVSTQVLQELAVVLRKKANPALGNRQVQEILVEILQAWDVFINNAVTIVSALDLEERFDISFWDALIVCAAEGSSCATLYTEDLNHGQRYGRVRAVNPFKI